MAAASIFEMRVAMPAGHYLCTNRLYYDPHPLKLMRERPLSPHLQVYRLPFTAVLSISHRLTGVCLAFGVVLWVAFLVAAAGGPDAYAAAQGVLDSLPGRLLLWAWIFALLFHLCHGVRHLIWDTVHGLDRDTLIRHGIAELAVAVGLTLLVLVYSLARG